MLNLKKILIAASILTALGATAFAAETANDAAQAQKPSMRERVAAIMHEDGKGDFRRGPCDGEKKPHHFKGERRGHGPMHFKDGDHEKRRAEWEKMTPEQREEARQKMEKKRAERREKWEKMTPEQREEARQKMEKKRAERREKWEKMTPEQREEARQKWEKEHPHRGPRPDGQHGPRGDKHFGEHGPHGPHHDGPGMMPPPPPMEEAK